LGKLGIKKLAMKIKINKEDAGKRLDVFLTKTKPAFSRSGWQKKIKEGGILVDGQKTEVHYWLKEGEVVEMANGKWQMANGKFGGGEGGEKLEMRNKKLRKDKNNEGRGDGGVIIIKETEDYLVINKPAGMVVHPVKKLGEGTLADWLIKKYPTIKKVGENKLRPGIVHRLDKEVSGVMVVAKTQKMFDLLKKQFQERKTEKEYQALVYGKMRQSEGEINMPITRDKREGKFKTRSDEEREGREAKTNYEVLKRLINYTLIKVKILTGRTHQIRVHLASIGHAIVGDDLYMTKNIRKKSKRVELERLWLYAVKLGFYDLAGKWQEFEVGAPEELEEFFKGAK
jgi:23S rRNA pseudouridine1911/1915/1917 synthase